ncbi:PREDICTED: procollagen-lysine,2-oxoglutarate 5-dioxygenase 1-like [Priapulus caudatus]|uniref:Procollagen-lysine,2-oxoglutarate 5-dioxygenase 1-like n=1 Tax=Priapulus caudatus TaxID=37621 RepID=A0ABM1ELH8_PRICU|nr:PREDICTED: procollagen-lysine,2-oxoglutarate 5-dioxygenase 1-like [Priapulus caudatus]
MIQRPTTIDVVVVGVSVAAYLRSHLSHLCGDELRYSFEHRHVHGVINNLKFYSRSTATSCTFQARAVAVTQCSQPKKYPEVQSGKHYLCSGGIIGYGADIYAVLTHKVVADGDDDQLYYTNIYLDAELRDKFKIKLDHKSEIFQNLNGARDDVKLMFEEGLPYVENTAYSTRPIVLHGNGLSKMYLLFLTNYVPGMWTVNRGCSWCDDDLIRLNDREESAYPLVTVALFIEKPTPFMEEHLQLFTSQFYPKKRIDLFIHSATRYHAQHIDTFLTEFKDQYRSIHHISANKSVTEWVARNAGISHCVEKGCEFYFVVDSEAQLVNPRAIQLLVEQNL